MTRAAVALVASIAAPGIIAAPFASLGVVVLVVVGVLFYFLPSVVAAIRGVPDFGLILVITFLGGTLIGWVVALYMAMRTVPPRPA